MVTAHIVERLVPEDVRVRKVGDGYVLSDGQWTTELSVDSLPEDSTAAEAVLKERIHRALLTLSTARDGEDISHNAERALA